MTDTPIKRILFSIKNGFNNICKTQFNYTNEYWYNFKSYICGTEISFTICKQCNNYKRLSDDHTYSIKRSNTRFLCNCQDENHSFDNHTIEFIKQEELFDRQFDDFDTVFIDIMNDFNEDLNDELYNDVNYLNNNMQRSIHIE
jgi:hypothetical protein